MLASIGRTGLGALGALAALWVLPSLAQTIIIDGSGVHNDGQAPTFRAAPVEVLPGSAYQGATGNPGRANLPFNTSRGPVMAPLDNSTPAHQFSGSDRITLRPPGSAAPAAAAAPRPAVTAVPAPEPKPRPAPQPAVTPAPAETQARSPAPQPRSEPPAVELPKTASPRVETPRPVPAPAPAAVQTPRPAPAAAPKPEPQVAAVTPPSAAPDAARILFDGGETEVGADGRSALETIARQALADRNLRIQIEAYADSDTETSVWKRRVSLRRAQNVRRILLDNGVESFRILVRALGEPTAGGPGNRVDLKVGSR